MASPRSSRPPGLEPPLLVGQSLEIWRDAAAPAPSRLEARQELERSARRQLDAGAGALDLNAGSAGDLAAELGACAGLLAGAFPDVPLFLDCGDAGALAGALLAASQAAPGRPGPLVANSLRADDRGSESLLRAAAWAGAGLVISPRDADGEGPAVAVAPLLARIDALGRRAHGAGVRGPLFADALAYPPLGDPARCRRSLALLRALRDSPAGPIPLVAPGNVGHGAPGPLRRALRRLYTAAALGAGARALILPVEDRALVALVRELTSAGARGSRPGAPVAGGLAWELPWLRRVARSAAAADELPAPPARAGAQARRAWEAFASPDRRHP